MANGPGIAREARLAFIVDGKGARQEVRLTADEMRALVSGGKEAAEVLKKAIPPSIVPPKVVPEIKGLTDAINRMREASRQATADAFGARLAIEMEKAEQAAMRLQRGLDGVTAARRRMQQAAGLAAGTAHASRIAALDPFQGAALAGPQFGPALPAHMNNSAAAAQKASMSFSRLQQNATSLAVAAGALPGPIGRIASSLSVFALGGGWAVAILGGLAAITLAIKKSTEGAREAAAMMDQVQSDRLGFSGRPLAAAIATSQAREARLKRELEQAQSKGGGIFGIDKDLPKIARLTKELADEKEFLAKATQKQADEERDLTGAMQLELDVMERLKRNVLAANYAGGAGALARTRDWRNPLAGIDDDYRAATMQNQVEFQRQSEEAKNRLTGKALEIKLKILSVEKETADEVARQRKDLDETNIKLKQKAAALQHLASFAIDTVAGAAGPWGGMISGIATNVMQGNMWGAAAAGVTGFVGALKEIFGSSRAAREALRQAKLQFDDFNNSVKVTLGLMSPLEYRLSGLRRSFEDSRNAVGATDEQIKRLERSLMTASDPMLIEALQREIDRRKELNAESAAIEAALTALEEQRAAKDLEFATRDLEVRQLLALGRDEEAAAMQLLLAQEREMEQARRDGKGALYELELAETHRLERVRAEMDKVQATIDSLTNTITGLESFRDTLKLDQTVSPADRLTEARRQYEAVLEAARSDDPKTAQDAAARLPGAAQALLAALREMFGSAPQFQEERQRIIADTEELINRFKDQKAVEELMLEELRRIAAHTDPDRIVNHPPIGELPTLPPGPGGGGGGGGGGGSDGTALNVQAAGFAALVAETRTNTAAIIELQRLQRRGFDQMAEAARN